MFYAIFRFYAILAVIEMQLAAIEGDPQREDEQEKWKRKKRTSSRRVQSELRTKSCGSRLYFRGCRQISAGSELPFFFDVRD